MRRIAEWNDQDARMRAQLVEESDGQIPEIISIAGDEAARTSRGAVQVLLIGEGSGFFLVRANRVESFLAEDFRDYWTQIGVEIELHAVVS